MAETGDGARIGRGHDAEQAGAVRLQRRRHRQIGGQRQCRVLVLRRQARREGERVAAIRHALDLLAWRIDPGGAARLLGGGDTAGDLVEAGRQVFGTDAVVGQLRPAADQRAFGAVEHHAAVGRDANGEHHRRTLPVGEQACGALADRGRIERGLAVGQIQRFAASPGFDIERVAVANEPSDIGDGVMEDQVGPRRFNRERLVEVGR